MFLAKNNNVVDNSGKTIEKGTCAFLFIGVDTLKEAHKTLICQVFPQRIFYVLNQERDRYFLGDLLYLDLLSWVKENLSDIKTANNLFGVSFIINIDNEERMISVRDILSDREKNPFCDPEHLIAGRLEAEIENMM